MKHRTVTSLLAVATALVPVAAQAAPDGADARPPRMDMPPDTFVDGVLDPAEGIVVEDAAQQLINGVYPKTAQTLVSLDDAMTFDESCWIELNGGYGSLPSAEADSDLPVCFPGNDGRQTCWGDEEIATYWEQLDHVTAEFGETSADLPLTRGFVDLGYWTKEARVEFTGCIGKTDGGLMSVVNVDPVQASSCLATAQRSVEEVCAPETAELCRDLGYHDSWCGRVSAQRNGEDPEWLCRAELMQAGAELADDPQHPLRDVLIPELMSTDTGPEVHLLDHTLAPEFRLYEHRPPRSADVFDVPGAVTDPIANSDVLIRAVWDSDPDISSCAEYGRARVYDLARLLEPTTGYEGDPRVLFDTLYAGYGSSLDLRDRDGAPIEFETDANGYLVPWSRVLDFSSDDERGARSFYGQSVPGHVNGGTAPLVYPDGTGGQTPDYTFKNVYAYLHALRQGPPASWSSGDPAERCQRWRTHQRLHYTVDSDWHAQMNAWGQARGYTDDDYAYLQTKQEELWNLYGEYLEEEDLDRRARLLYDIDQRLVEGIMLGCVPLDHVNQSPGSASAVTPCDWSPSIVARGVQRKAQAEMEHLERWCVDALHDGFLDASQDPEFQLFEPEVYCNEGIPTATCVALHAEYNDIPSDPLHNEYALRNFIHEREDYWTVIEQALDELPFGAFGTGASGEFAHSGQQEYFGSSAFGSTTSGLRTSEDGAGTQTSCDAVPYLEHDSGAGVRIGASTGILRELFGSSISVQPTVGLEFGEAIQASGALTIAGIDGDGDGDPDGQVDLGLNTDGEFSIGTSESGGVDLATGLSDLDLTLRLDWRVTGHLQYAAATNTFSATRKGSASLVLAAPPLPIVLGPVTVAIKLGASAGLEHATSMAMSRTPVSVNAAGTACTEHRKNELLLATNNAGYVTAQAEVGTVVGIPGLATLKAGVGGTLDLIRFDNPIESQQVWDWVPNVNTDGTPMPEGSPSHIPTFWGRVLSKAKTSNLVGKFYAYLRAEAGAGPLSVTIFNLKIDFNPWMPIEPKEEILIDKVFNGEDFCDKRPAMLPPGTEHDEYLCACGQMSYCEDGN